MCEPKKIVGLLQKLDADEEGTIKAQERLEECREELLEVERMFMESKQGLAEAARQAYQKKRARLEYDVNMYGVRRARLLKKRRRVWAKMQDLKDRGDIEAASEFRVVAESYGESLRRLSEFVEHAKLKLAHLHMPQTNFERWLSPDDEVVRQHERLRQELKKVRCKCAEAARDCKITEAIEAATREMLTLELEAMVGAEGPRAEPEEVDVIEVTIMTEEVME